MISELLKNKTPEELLKTIEITKSLRDFKVFTKRYFPHYQSLPLALCHHEFAEVCESILSGNGGHRIVRAAPRGVAKTTWFSVFLPLRAIATSSKKFIVIVSDTEPQAIAQLRKIKTELEYNEQFKADFGDLKGDEWSNNQFITKNGVMVLALGAKQKIRGAGNQQFRPDLIILDDIENDKEVLSQIQRHEKIDLINEAVMYAGASYTDVIMVGTILHQDSVLSNFINNPLWNADIYKSVLNWSPRKDLWNNWEGILTNLNDRDRRVTALAYFELHKDEMLENTKVIWPSSEPYYSLMELLVSGGPSAFAKEKQNDPRAASECPFDPDKFQFYDGNIYEELDFYAFIDPSMGDKETSDYSAIIVMGVGRVTTTRYIIEADIKKRSPDIIIEDMIGYCRKYPFTKVESESNAFQKYWTLKLAERMAQAGFGDIRPEGVNHTGNKVARIKSMQPDIHNGTIKFFRKTQTLLLQQLEFFPLGTNDDGPDALEACNELAQQTHTFVFGSL